MQKVELLSPARDLVVGKAAIDNGADAVYIGAPAFGARKAAANSLEDIGTLVGYAHRFYCRVFVTLNTILYDSELAEAEKMIRQLYAIGVDALIIQDPGILNMDLPPICLHASTQMHNYELERIKFLDQLGFQRIVLARELSLEQIREIRKEVKAELEVFIHGALCVSLSGQCYLSQYMFGRSANRGECAQPCRMKWTVEDNSGKKLIKDKYVLSLKDLNLSSYIDDLIEAGVDSFKIEGRLKDENYVANVTNYYSSLIGKHPGIVRSGSGHILSAFEADPERSFSRGSSDYFIRGRHRGLVNMDTPKSMGKKIGIVKEIKGNTIILDAIGELANGDGLCYLEQGGLKGIKVNEAVGNRIVCNETVKLRPGTELFRNYDHRFNIRLDKVKSVRKIRIKIKAWTADRCLWLEVTDEDGVQVNLRSEETFEKAQNPQQAERLKQQLLKCGDSDFECESVDLKGEEVLFIPAAAANALRRKLLEELIEAREARREKMLPGHRKPLTSVPVEADWHYNIANQGAKNFYEACGVPVVGACFEKSGFQSGEKDLMHTRYCLLYELGRCRKMQKNKDLEFPLFLVNDKHRFRLEFDCQRCFMKVIKYV